MKKKILLVALVLAIAGGLYGYYQYNRKTATASERTTDFTLTADALKAEYDKNEEAANKKFLEKTIEVSGTLESISKNGKVYDASLATDDPMTLITVQLAPEENENASKLKAGDKVVLKGICKGKNADIELNRGAIINK